MLQKKLVLLLNTNQQYVRHLQEEDIKKFAPEINRLFESITDTYIPLLWMFEKLEAEGVAYKIQMVLPPVLCTLLEDTVIQAQYVDWLSRAEVLCAKEVKRVSKNKTVQLLAQNRLDVLKKCHSDFTERYGMRLIPQFALHQKAGNLEIMATTGTDIFMPFYKDLKEVLSAQVETGLLAYKTFFGEIPDGFWLPDLGYAEGVESIIRAYGFNYTVLDPRSTLLAKELPKDGIFYPCRFYNSLACFTATKVDGRLLYNEDDGFAENEVYRNENRDIAFELPAKELAPFIENGTARYASGCKYFNKSFDSDLSSVIPEDETELYNPETALEQVQKDAENFISVFNAELNHASELASNTDFVSETVVINLDDMRKNWSEGINWIEALFRNADKADFEYATCNELLENQYSMQKIYPYYASNLGAGYGENLLSNKNCWMMRYVRKASERMVDLAERFPTDTGLKARLLDLAAKELMIAQSSGWAKMLDDDISPEYVKTAFTESINAFTMVFDSLGSNTVSTEWLTNLEAEHPLFPWMNYRIFSKKQ